MNKALFSLTVLLAALGSTGCPEFAGVGARPDGFRLVEGRLVLPDDGVIGRQVTALQIAAVAVAATADDEGGLITQVQVFTSPPFDPGVRREESAFVVAVDSTVSFNLVLQVPTSGGQGVGDYLGALTFDDGRGNRTTLIPPGLTDLALGETEALDPEPTLLTDNELRVATGNNPLGQVDTDGDGTVDLFDEDDDGDGTPDSSDPDVAGDGIDDSLQTLAGMDDADADGIPDIFASSGGG